MELIVAQSLNGIIGHKGSLLWHLSGDLKRFKRITMDTIIIMGRKTFESFPNGPLPNRIHIVLTRSPEYIDDASKNVYYTTYENLNTIIDTIRIAKDYPIFVIGGYNIYKMLYPMCAKLHITVVYANVLGDTHFPIMQEMIDRDFLLQHGSAVQMDKRANLEYKFLTYIRKNPI